jgi:rhodanese-related sulfurtransferase
MSELAQKIELTPRQVYELVEAERVLVLDVREEEELAEGSLPGSHHTPLSAFSEVTRRLRISTPVVCYCTSGVRSLFAAEALRTVGVEAYSLAGGIEAWMEQDLPVEESFEG